MADLIITILPAWLICVLAAVTMGHRWYTAYRWKVSVVSREENILYAIALTNITVFYAGLAWDWWDLTTRIAISRLVWAWLLIVSLYISQSMAKRQNQ